MASVISGFEYDVFISYRRKDNKHDGWVTEFVNHLRGELESAFKEDISVYFDSNPTDGLLETHDVDASVKDKLNCLIFIPVISRTYCDPKSFAWQFEFLPFVKKASDDRFGIKVKLPGGNIASRVLPIQIYDLDPFDKKLVEDLLGGYIRGIEFIYKSTGVNRPLLPKEDNPQDNQNRTNYRDQINKVANAIKDILDGLRNPDINKTQMPGEEVENTLPPARKLKPKIISGVLILVAFIMAGFFVISNVLTRPKEKSIAVLPFHNYSDSIGQEWMSDGLTEEIINHLYRIKSFNRVVPLSTVMTYKGSIKKIHMIANELKVNYILEGTYKKIGDKVRINAQLVDPKKERYIWQYEYDKSDNEIANIQVDIALKIADQVKAYISGSELKNLQNSLTVIPEAYNLYLQGRYFWNKRTKEGLLRSIDLYEESIAVDPYFGLAWAGLADTYNILVFWDWWPAADGFSRAKEYALKAIRINPDLAEAHAIYGDILIWSDWKWDEAESELKLAVELNPNCGVAHQYYSEFLDIIRKNSEAREQIDMALQLDPVSPVFYTTSALYYCNEGKFEESLTAGLKTLEINPDFTKSYPLCIYSYLRLGEEKQALQILKKSMLRDSLTAKYAVVLDGIYEKEGMNGIFNWLIGSEQMKPNPSLITIAWIYAVLGKKDESIDWLEKALLVHSPDLPRINNYIIFSEFHSDPRFQAILEKIGLSKLP
jgi:TolB-like protein